MQLNWWESGYEIVARDVNGKLTVIGCEDDEEREDWLEENKDLLEMDDQDPIAQTGKSEELVLLADGRLLLYVSESGRYKEIDEFGPVVALHDDVVETDDGKFYKCERNGSKYKWQLQEYFETERRYCEDGFTYVYDGPIEPWSTEKYTAVYSAGVVTIISEFIPEPEYEAPDWKYKCLKTTLEMDVIDYCDGYLLCSNGDVFCMTGLDVIQQIMVHQKSRKPAI